MIAGKNSWLFAALMAFAGSPAAGFCAEIYWLGPQDKIKIGIYEYPNISGEVVVGPSGDVGIPLIGSISAEGLTTDELADAVGRRLIEIENLPSRPSVTAQIVEFRPFYVTGNVEKPGRYAYEPGMTVIKAVSTAGGVFRPSDHPDLIRLGRDATNAEGSIQTLKITAEQLRFRIERLRAELDNRPDYLAIGEAGATTEMGNSFRQREQLIFQARAKLISGQTDALTKLRKVYEAEVVSLRERVRLKRIEIDTAQKDLDRVGKLAERGVTASSQTLERERIVADLRGEEEELLTQVLRAEQGVTQSEQSLRSVVDGRRRDIIQELHNAEVELRETAEKAKTAKSLLNEALVLAPAAYNQMISEPQVRMSYRIIRLKGKNAVEIPAEENDTVQAGDVVKIFALVETN
ncbi:polysaccharide biosynthesis/export family protein [Rhizobium sullae]|uniref:Polysaccharide export outer membrane protein/exopolysaccharide production protein ExoF n=1 Tax=Rhizobium sullae TaxID=50338 RepID=A0A4R3PSE6_RHISU|nr:polysaccharide biosynthesis/export family protein [Rhizobium sullae]TCU06823.1 polysaccharide export outer membrane protein/exopolysaccharide production protein ExoF [Rhizobium sullae]